MALSRETKALIPNRITAGRLYAICPVLSILLIYQYFTTAIIVSIVGFASDGLDGYLARKWNVISVWGSKWDPVADKISTWPLFAFGLCWYHEHPRWEWYALAACIIGLYDIVVTTVLWKLRGKEIHTNKCAKYKTTCLMIGLVATLVSAAIGHWLETMWWITPLIDAFAILLIFLSAGLALVSGLDYLRQYRRIPFVQAAE